MTINVLILEDSLIMSKILKRALVMSRLPIKDIHLARTYSEGVTVLKDDEIGLALVDYNMNGLGGISSFLELKKQAGATTIKIVALASHYSLATANQLQEQNITLIHLPITPEGLHQKLKELF